jgi:hypothetical protein
MLRRVALVRTDVSVQRSASIIRVTRIGELGTALAVTSDRRTPHGVTFQKTLFFIVTAVKTSDLIQINTFGIFNIYWLEMMQYVTQWRKSFT